MRQIQWLGEDKATQWPPERKYNKTLTNNTVICSDTNMKSIPTGWLVCVILITCTYSRQLPLLHYQLNDWFSMSEGALLEDSPAHLILHSHSPHTIQIINTLNFRNHSNFFFFTHYIIFINKEIQPCLLKLSKRESTKWIMHKTEHDLSVQVWYERMVRWSIVDRI